MDFNKLAVNGAIYPQLSSKPNFTKVRHLLIEFKFVKIRPLCVEVCGYNAIILTLGSVFKH